MARKKKPLIKSWGEDWHEGINYGPGHQCPICYENEKWGIQLADEIIGFVLLEEPHRKETGIVNIGKIIILCKKCDQKFWFHLSTSTLKIFMRICPNWPKE